MIFKYKICLFFLKIINFLLCRNFEGTILFITCELVVDDDLRFAKFTSFPHVTAIHNFGRAERASGPSSKADKDRALLKVVTTTLFLKPKHANAFSRQNRPRRKQRHFALHILKKSLLSGKSTPHNKKKLTDQTKYHADCKIDT